MFRVFYSVRDRSRQLPASGPNSEPNFLRRVHRNEVLVEQQVVTDLQRSSDEKGEVD